MVLIHPGFLWDPNQRHPRAHITNGGYTVSIGENATWVSLGANTVLSHGCHYWEVVLEKYGAPSLSRKAVIGVVTPGFHQWHRYCVCLTLMCFLSVPSTCRLTFPMCFVF